MLLNNSRQVTGKDNPAFQASHAVPQSQAKVAILLCTYNGQQFLSEQLQSFETQRHTNWTVWASDDGSSDGTWELLQRTKAGQAKGRFFLQSGPGKGFVANFLSLIFNRSIEADYYAFSDQDDIWEPEKLERALNWLQTVRQDVPALYCSRTRLVNADNQDIGYSPLFDKAPSFANALVQNIGGGNTMVFNNEARNLLLHTDLAKGIVSHDWWVYLVVTACGGQVYYDKNPAIRYRQHGRNLVGSDNNWLARVVRLRWLAKGRFKTWSDLNIAGLENLRPYMTSANQSILSNFCRLRRQNLVQRLIGLKRSAIYRQTFFGNIGLLIAVLLKRV